MIQPTFWGKNVAISCSFCLLISKCHVVLSDLSAFPHGNLWHSRQGGVYENLCKYSFFKYLLGGIEHHLAKRRIGISRYDIWTISRIKLGSLLTSLIWAKQVGKFTWVELEAALCDFPASSFSSFLMHKPYSLISLIKVLEPEGPTPFLFMIQQEPFPPAPYVVSLDPFFLPLLSGWGSSWLWLRNSTIRNS